MPTNKSRNQDQARMQWEKARGRSSSEVLAILAPTAEEPRAIQRKGVWKTDGAVPVSGSSA